MRTLDEILSNYKSNCVDGRDTYRLWKFIPWDVAKNYPDFLENIKEEYRNEDKWMAEVYEMPYTRENILEQLRSDVAFGFQKALDRRGISAGLMFEVVRCGTGFLTKMRNSLIGQMIITQCTDFHSLKRQLLSTGLIIRLKMITGMSHGMRKTKMSSICIMRIKL